MTDNYFTKESIKTFISNPDGSHTAKYTGIEIKDGKLFREDRQIIPREDVIQTIDKIYKDPEIGFRSAGKTWQYVKSRYEGITATDVMNYMKNNTTAQIIKQPKPNKVNKPIVVGGPMKLFQVDLSDVSRWASLNNNINYLLCAIDVFTKFAAVRPITNKTATSVSKAMDDILTEYGAPGAIQSDNGSEFIAEEFRKVLEYHDVKQIFSSPYHPRSNGVVERFNRTLKGMISKFMIAYNTKHYADALQKIVNNYNSQIHSTTSHTPEELKDAYDADDEDDEKIDEARDNIERAAIKSVKNRATYNFVVGDVVRVALSTDAEIRKDKLFRKGYDPQFSNKLYKIAAIDEPEKYWNPEVYWLYDIEAHKVLNRKFYGDQLLPVKKKHLIGTVPNNERPAFSDVFNRERHLNEIRRGVEEKKEVEPSEEKKERPKRNIRKPKRYEE